MDAGSAHVTGDRDIVVEFTDKVGKVTREVMEDREDRCRNFVCCKKVWWYCGQDCQHEAWKEHKKECKKLVAAAKSTERDIDKEVDELLAIERLVVENDEKAEHLKKHKTPNKSFQSLFYKMHLYPKYR